MSEELKGLVLDMPSLGSMAEVYHEIDGALKDPNSSAEDIGFIIEKDPSLTACLLKLANSSFYGFPSRVDTVSQAITMIGLGEVRHLASATLVLDYFSGIPTDEVDMCTFWEHSLACGIAARIIAIQRRMAQSEQFFVAGLLHDLGRLVLFIRKPEEMAQVFETYHSSDTPLIKCESNLLGYDHTDVGHELLKLWKFPVNLIHAAKYHHFPLLSDFYPIEASIVHVADAIVHSLELGHSGEASIPPLRKGAWEQLDLSPVIVSNIVQDIDKQFHDTVKIFLDK